MTKRIQIKINKQFLIISFVVVAVYLILEAYYAFFLSGRFDHLGFHLSFNTYKYVETKLLFCIFMFLSEFLHRKSKFIYAVYLLLLLFFFMPNAIIYAFADQIRGPLYSISLFLLLFIIITPHFISIKTINLTNYSKQLIIVSVSLLLLLPIVLTFKLNINLKTLLLQDIYTTRDSFTALMPSLYNYFYNWEVKVIVPVMLTFFLIGKKYSLALLAFLILIYLFVISGNKAVYLTSIVTLFFYFIGTNNYDSKIKLFFILLLFVLIIIPLIDYFIVHDIWLRGTFIMRMFFFPALLNYCYFDFYATTPLYFSENHFFNLLFQSPYETPSAYLISKVYFNTTDMYANNGIISDGYMNLGYLGVFILSTLFALLFLFFNSMRIDARYFGIFLISVFFFLSAPVFTILITGGVWILFIFALILMKNTD